MEKKLYYDRLKNWLLCENKSLIIFIYLPWSSSSRWVTSRIYRWTSPPRSSWSLAWAWGESFRFIFPTLCFSIFAHSLLFWLFRLWRKPFCPLFSSISLFLNRLVGRRDLRILGRSVWVLESIAWLNGFLGSFKQLGAFIDFCVTFGRLNFETIQNIYLGVLQEGR